MESIVNQLLRSQSVRFLILGFLSLFVGYAWAGAEKKPAFPLSDQGTEFPVLYKKYGEFSDIGGSRYRYRITDKDGLARAMGMGLFPNPGATLQEDSAFQAWRKKNNVNSNPWDHVNTGDSQSDFYIWAHASGVGPGTRLFFTAQALESAGHLRQAVKAYYAVVVHFPKETCYSEDRSFQWYLSKEALNRIEALVKQNPELGVRLRNAEITIQNAGDPEVKNHVLIANPGEWVERGEQTVQDLSVLAVKQTRGTGKVRLVQYENGHWQLLVDRKPYVIKGVHYSPTVPGRDAADTQGAQWMFEDTTGSGRPDAPYDTWIDKNRNGKRDAGDPVVGDFQLLKDMGANTIKIFRLSQALTYKPEEFNKTVLRDLHKNFGISVIMGDFLGAYTVGSGADWDDGTDYTDPEQLKRMKNLVRDYVNDHKNEPYVLMWLLGNENLMPSDYSGVNATRTKASKQVEAYLRFVNEVAEMIHELDPDHPVAVGNLGTVNLADHSRYAPAVDIFGLNSYPGAHGFGQMWEQVQRAFDRPVLLTEYGADAFNSRTNREDQDSQAEYHKGNWLDIEMHLAGGPETGNAIGGVIFEFLDEWWKSPHGAWDIHDDTQDSPMAFQDGWSSEEWLGVVSQGLFDHVPLMRQPRKAYYLYRDELWK